MEAVLIAAYFVMLVVTVASVYVAYRLYNAIKETKQQREDERKLSREWAQRIVADNTNKVQEAGQEGFNAGRQDMLGELKERVDRGEIEIKIISTPVAQPTKIPVQ